MKNTMNEISAIDEKKLIRQIKNGKISSENLQWATFYGTKDIKLALVKNPTTDIKILEAIAMDAEIAPYIVLDLLNRKEIFTAFISNIYEDYPYDDAESFDNLLGEISMARYVTEDWEKQIPKSGSCTILQSELVRITWRFGRTWNYLVAYKLDYDERMMEVLFNCVDRMEFINSFSKNIMRSLLRWSQIIHRGGHAADTIETHGYERFATLDLIVDVFLRKFTEPIHFDSIAAYGE
jgi:hypothetical protein